MKYTFTFLRHGQSVGNQQHVFQGQTDYPLNEIGTAQIENLASEWALQGKTFQQIISSPLSRAVQTAKIIQDHIDAPLTTKPLWLERSAGALEGTILEQAFHAKRHLYEAVGDFGESDWQLYLRAGHAIQDLLKNPPGDYLIVSHGGLLQKVLTIITGAKPEAAHAGFSFQLDNGAYAEVAFDTEDYTWEFHALCQSHFPKKTDHLPERSSRFLLVRHAQSEGNIQRIFQGQMETPLTTLGVDQAKLLGQYFAQHQQQYHIQKIFSSPQIRAHQTAEQIAQPLDLKIVPSDLLKEIHNGEMAGLTNEEISQRFPERLDHKTPYAPVGETGESWFELFLRGGKVVDMFTALSPGSYLVVSHGAILNAIIWAIIGVAPRYGWNEVIFRFQNAGFFEINYSPDQRQWRMIQMIPSEHLRI